tara:strand:- start:861 stop:2435 length:1575 start_codon:yes stop_codon:yes gene_type:complete
LAEYVVENPQSFLVNDVVVTLANNPIVIDPLSNDSFTEPEKVAITEVTPPKMGTAVVNDDNTITYTPDTDQTGTDEFDYSTSVTNPDNTVSKETGSVTVTVTDKTPTTEEPVEMGELKAFPGAEGFGQNTTGGRGGSVIYVTNLNNSGEGSLRAALNQTGTRTIIFRTGGTIKLLSPLSIAPTQGNVTIAGETASGDGITLIGAGLEINTSNVIVRHLRIRVGKNGDPGDALRIVTWNQPIENVIVDHCSLSWANDENLSIVGTKNGEGTIRNVTIQNSIISESFNYAVLVMYNVTNVSFYKNLLANNNDRQFHSSVCGSEFEIVNNLIYNYKRGTELTYEGKYDLIGNTYKSSTNISPDTYSMRYQINRTNCPNGDPNNGSIHQSDNISIGNSYPLTHPDWGNYNSSNRVITNSLIKPMPQNLVEDNLLPTVGASLKRDMIDSRIISEYRNLTGSLISVESTVGGFLTNLSAGNPYTDEDMDGMDDNWENANNLDPSNPNDGKEVANGDGYTNLEKFLQYLNQ